MLNPDLIPSHNPLMMDLPTFSRILPAFPNAFTIFPGISATQDTTLVIAFHMDDAICPRTFQTLDRSLPNHPITIPMLPMMVWNVIFT